MLCDEELLKSEHFPQLLNKETNSLTFVETDMQAKKIISFPCDQHLSDSQISEIIAAVKHFYENR